MHRLNWFLLLTLIARLSHADFGISLQNTPFDVHTWEDTVKKTPFDPQTWKDTVKNTPLDPKTWKKTVEDVADPAGAACNLWLQDTRRNNQTARTLDHTEKFYLRPWFGDLVDTVTVFHEARLNGEIKLGAKVLAVPSSAQTIGTTIYMRDKRVNGHPAQMVQLAHEMTHVWQYVSYGKDLRTFCRAYMNGYLTNDLNYFRNPLEHAAFIFETQYANWLQAVYPNPQFNPVQYGTGSPYQTRTSWIPGWLIIPQVEFAVTCVENPSNLNIGFSMRYGTGQWVVQPRLAPGAALPIALELPGGSRKDPLLQISFDTGNGAGNKQYNLEAAFIPSRDCVTGKRYYFLIDAQGKVDLSAR